MDTNDWWGMAETIVPQLRDYAKQFDIDFDEADANELIIYKDHRSLFKVLHNLWFDLPDCKEICQGPFYSLCELCSEYWIFERGDH